jgi:hypothetical protein
MANQGFSRIFSWCETPPGSTKEVECACVPIHNASKLQGLPIDPDLELICNAGDTLIFDGTEWVCSATGPTGCDCESATGFFSSADCTFQVGSGTFLSNPFTRATYTRINNINTISFPLEIEDVTTAGGTNREMIILCNFPNFPGHPLFTAEPGAVGGIALKNNVLTELTGLAVAGNSNTTVQIILLTGTALTGAVGDIIQLQVVFKYITFP